MLYHVFDRYVMVLRLWTTTQSLTRIVEIPDGFGRHIDIFPPGDRIGKTRSWLKCLFVFEVFFHIATTLSKVAMYVFHSMSSLKPWAK